MQKNNAKLGAKPHYSYTRKLTVIEKPNTK